LTPPHGSNDGAGREKGQLRGCLTRTTGRLRRRQCSGVV
jgi:hypothetical protein